MPTNKPMSGAISRRQMGVSLLGAAAAPLIRAATAKSPNVLLIMASSLRGDSLGCMGHPLVQTPNFNLLADQGARCTNIFSAAPDGAAGRASLLTGRYPKTHGVRRSGDALNESEVLFPELFRAAGYRTGFCGRLGLAGVDAAKAFETLNRVLPGAEYDEYMAAAMPGFTGSIDDISGGYDRRTLWRHGRSRIPGAHFPDHWTSDRSIDFINAEDERPWFLLAHYIRPEAPWIIPRPYAGSYEAEYVRVPILPDERPSPTTERDEESHYITGPRRKSLQRAKAGYYAAISYADLQIGRVLVGLKRSGERDNTLVVVVSDHGISLGEGGRMMDHTPTDQALHVPLLVRFPDRVEAKTTVNRVADTTTIAPTLLELAGLNVPEGLESSSVAEEIKQPTAESDGVAHSEFGFQTVRSSEWKLTLPNDHKTWEAQLFDLKNDPAESTNLYAVEEHAKVRRDFESQLKKWASRKPARVPR